jgi:polyisoprenoid-binding protein YceI
MTTNTWNIDTGHSGVNFSVRHLVFSKVRGQFRDWRGSLQYSPEAPEKASVQVEIDAASIDTGVGDRDKHLRSPDFFAVEQFPKLRYESTRVEVAGEGRLRVHGNLTIRDVTREVTLDVESLGSVVDPWGNQRVAFSAKASIDRGDFGLKWNQVLEAGGVMVGERIDIELEIAAVAAAKEAAA